MQKDTLKGTVKVFRHMNWAKQIARNYCLSKQLPAQNFDDYSQAAMLGLVEASRRFDPQKGIPFKNYAFTRIKGAIVDEIRSQSFLSKSAYDLKNQLCNLENGSGQIKVFNRQPSALLAYRESFSENTDSNLVDEETPLKAYERKEVKCKLLSLISKLSQVEAGIIKQFYQQDLSLSEIARHCESRSKATICRLHNQAIAKLKKNFLLW